MKTLKKILALALATMMVLAMGTVAFADNGITTNAAKTMNIPITQTMYFKNAEGSQVYEPNLYYTYGITPGAEGATVKDHAGNQVTVKAGDMRAFGAADATTEVEFGINFSSDHKLVTAAVDGKAAVTKKVTVVFNGEALTTGTTHKEMVNGVETDVADITPGVYRYIITQKTSTDQKKAVGVTEVGTDTDKTLVLDVYVQADGTVGGAAMHEPNADPSNPDNPSVDNSNDPNKDGNKDEKDDENGKTTGFGDPEDPSDPNNPFGDEDPKDTTPDDPTKPAGDEDDPNTQQTKFSTPTNLPTYYDLYTTYNVIVTKEVTGKMGDKSNFFPFQADISNSIPGAAFTYSVTDNATNKDATKTQLVANAGTKTLGSATATAADGLAIKHGGKINLIGVPSSTAANVSVLVNEFNNTADQYKVTATDFGITADSILNASRATTASTPASFKDDDANTTFTVTNKLDEVSPTGVVLRFAPYLAMLGAGLLIVLVARRKKSENED